MKESGMRSVAAKTKARRAPRGRERVQHILGESLECFAAEGFDRVTYDDLIRRSKVSRGSFYWYFPSKEALYDAVLDYCVSGYVERAEAQFAKTNANDHVVRRLLHALLADFNANRSRYRVLLRPPPSAGAIEKLTRWNDDAGAFIAGKLAPLVADGRLDAKTAKVLPDVLSAFLDGICVRLVLGDEGSVSTLSRNVEEFLCRIVVDGRTA
jgi:AcrR family transcriptional regulator